MNLQSNPAHMLQIKPLVVPELVLVFLEVDAAESDLLISQIAPRHHRNVNCFFACNYIKTLHLIPHRIDSCLRSISLLFLALAHVDDDVGILRVLCEVSRLND